jgi:hypothetical protein
MERRFYLSSAWFAPTLQRIAIELLPNSPIVVFGPKERVRARDRLESISLRFLVGIVSILTRKGDGGRRGR